MVQIDIPAAFIASQLFLDIGRKAIQKEAAEAGEKLPAIYYKYLFRAVFFAGFVIAPAGIYLLSGWPGWEQMYWTSRVENLMFNWVNALYPTFFIMAIVLCAYGGHVIGYKWLTTGREKYLRPTYIGVLVVVTVLVLANYPAFLLVGTYAQYHTPGHEGMGYVWQNHEDFSIGWLIIMGYFVVAFAYMAYTLWKERKAAI